MTNQSLFMPLTAASKRKRHSNDTAAAKQRRWVRISTLCMALVLVLLLSGCLLQRIFRVKDQLCDFENNFRIEVNQGVRVSLLNPVLLDRDITYLTGAKPTERRINGRELLMRYIVEKQGAATNPAYDIPVELRFVLMDGNYKLNEGYVSKNLTEVLTSELITQCIRSACEAEKSLVQRRVSVDVRNIDRSLLPTRPQVITALGKPNGMTYDQSRIWYEYKLKAANAPQNRARIDAYFDESGNAMLLLRIKYLRYLLNADFMTGKAIFRLEGRMESES